MNILHLSPDFNYGDGRSYYVYLLLKYLNRYGHNAVLFTNGGDSFERLTDLHIPFKASRTFSQRLSFPRSVKLIAGIIAEENIDIIHSHHRFHELIAVAAAQISGRKVKTVHTALSIVDRRYSVEFKSGKIIAVSRSVRDMLINKFSVNKNKIVLIPNFADSEEIPEYENLPVKKNGFNLLCVGRLHKEKDQMVLLKAIALLKDKSISLTLIGEGPEYEAYNDFILRNSVNARIIPPVRKLNKFFIEADICVLPSVRDPFPGFMLQSGLFKKPFIGTDTDGIAELIVHRENGLLFRKSDERDLSEKIMTFIEDKPLADRCRMNFFEDVSKNYTEKKIIPEIIKLYEDLTD